MAINSVHGNFTVVNANTVNPKFFWDGTELTEVVNSVMHTYDGFASVKLTVQNTTTFDTQYAQMTTAGIQIKKKPNV